MRRFLFSPRTLNGESRWLEFADIRQRYMFEDWFDEAWVDEKPQRVQTLAEWCAAERLKLDERKQEFWDLKEEQARRKFEASNRVESPTEEGQIEVVHSSSNPALDGLMYRTEYLSDPGGKTYEEKLAEARRYLEQATTCGASVSKTTFFNGDPQVLKFVGKQSVAEWAEKNLSPSSPALLFDEPEITASIGEVQMENVTITPHEAKAGEWPGFTMEGTVVSRAEQPET